MNWHLVPGIKDRNMKWLQMLLNSLKGKNKEISQNILAENGFVNIPLLHENW